MTLKAGISGIWIIATGVIIALLYFGRGVLVPFALAVFLFLVIEGFARVIDEKLDIIERAWSRLLALVLVTAGFIGFIILMGNGVAQFVDRYREYIDTINTMIGDIYALFSLADPPTLQEILQPGTVQVFASEALQATQSLTGSLVLILIYLAFLFIAQSSWSHKLDRIFPEDRQRDNVKSFGDEARRGIETYLWTQTVISLIITVLTYVTLWVLGAENIIFLCALIFVLNYIPTIGSIAAAAVPPLFALVQPDMPGWIPGEAPLDRYIYAIIVFAGVSFWQFAIGNFLQPRMMGDSLNLSALVVLLALAVWGAIWGIPGMFLSAPFTVLMMLLFAQHRSTRWIAILLSADGEPGQSEETKSAAHSETQAATD